MNIHPRKTLGLALLLPCIAWAAADGDYATQWQLSITEEGGAYRVVLDADVYRAAHHPVLADVDVVDAAGTPVPASLFAAAAPSGGARQRIALPWFPLPADAVRAGGGVVVDVERDVDGSVRRVGTQLSAQPSSADRGEWLLDASRVEGRVVALELTWEDGAAALDARYRIEGSEDLRDWRVLQPNAALVDLARDGERLQQRRIALDAQARYLRLVPVGGRGTPALTAVHAQVEAAVDAPQWQWQALEGVARSDETGAWFYYELDGRFPVEVVDVRLPGHSTGQWTLYSRDGSAEPWRLQAGPWVAYRIGDGDAERSAPQALPRVFRDRQWKLVGATPTQQAPGLQLGWRPESIVFVAQGAPPYRLVAGSARATRAAAPVPQLLEAIRQQQGGQWQPGPATLGASGELAGAAALQPPAQVRDWRNWLLWGLLVAGTLLVAGFAASLLRQPPRARD